MRVDPRRSFHRILATVLFIAAAVLAATVPASLSQAAVVNRVEVVGNQRVDAATIQAYLSIQLGENFSPADEDASLKALFETGLFADVGFDVRGSTLVVTVVENPVISEIAFEGNKKFKDDQLVAVISSKPRGVFTRAQVQNDVAKILELYRRSARFQASVTPETIELPNNRVNLVFVVTEGPKTGVSGITFIGNQAFGEARLRTVIQTRRTSLLTFMRGGDVYDPDQLSADEEKLRRYYLDRGFADFQVISSVADLDRERNDFFISFTIQEGPRYRFGAISVDSSIPGVDPAVLEREVLTDEGDVFSAGKVEQSLEAITLYLAAHGYPFAQARPRLDRDPDALTIGVTYVVDEGARVYIERIEVRGNTRTRDYVIRREFDLAEGDAFNRVLVDRAERRLKRLGYFSSVRIFTEPGSSEDRLVVVVQVVEQPTGEFSFGIGYSSADGAVGDISLTEKNFLGRGYNMRISVGGGTNTRTYEFGFTDPYFLGRRISAGVNVYRRSYSESNFRSYDYDTTGGGLTFGFPITEDFTVQSGYKIEFQEINVDANKCDYDDGDPTNDANNVSRAICDAEGETLVSSVFYSLIYDTLDSYTDPHDGFYAKFNQDFAGVGGDVAYVRTTGTAAYYRELLPDRDIVGLIKVQGGHIVGLGEDVRLLDAFFKGGETVRGFRTSGFGPRDVSTDDALGGNIYAAATAEVQFPLPLLPREIGLKGAFFGDAGTLFDTDYTAADLGPGGDLRDDASIRSSIGGSILWASPVGPLRADFAHVLTSESYDETTWFRFGGGTRF
jgi:outer membrane protein insertion porin family